MREDILAGLKNAIARGVTLEQAVQSFINAGYNSSEVNQAAQSLMQGAIPVVNQSQNIPQQPPSPQQAPMQKMPQPLQYPQSQNTLPNQNPQQQRLQNIKKPKRKFGLIIFLITVLLILIGALVFTIFFGEEVLSKIFK